MWLILKVKKEERKKRGKNKNHPIFLLHTHKPETNRAPPRRLDGNSTRARSWSRWSSQRPTGCIPASSARWTPSKVSFCRFGLCEGARAARWKDDVRFSCDGKRRERGKYKYKYTVRKVKSHSSKQACIRTQMSSTSPSHFQLWLPASVLLPEGKQWGWNVCFSRKRQQSARHLVQAPSVLVPATTHLTFCIEKNRCGGLWRGWSTGEGVLSVGKLGRLSGKRFVFSHEMKKKKELPRRKNKQIAKRSDNVT